MRSGGPNGTMIAQVYEIQTPQEAEKCIALGVDHIGSVVLSQDEWRQPLLKEVILLSEGTEVKNSLIPLFRDKDPLYRVLDYYRPSYIHFCDSLTDPDGSARDLNGFIQLQTEIKEKFPEIGIIRTIPIPRKTKFRDFPTLKIARELEPVSSLFLIDTWVGQEPVEGFIGITGVTVDWEIAGALVLQSEIPVILAGGLAPDNVYQALTEVLPAGADSCTRTNEVDENGKLIRFKKDFIKVEKFVKEIRRAGQDIRDEEAELVRKINGLKEKLEDREAALPAHSVRPHQIMVIEELEEEIESLVKRLRRLRKRVPLLTE